MLAENVYPSTELHGDLKSSASLMRSSTTLDFRLNKEDGLRSNTTPALTLDVAANEKPCSPQSSSEVYDSAEDAAYTRSQPTDTRHDQRMYAEIT